MDVTDQDYMPLPGHREERLKYYAARLQAAINELNDHIFSARELKGAEAWDKFRLDQAGLVGTLLGRAQTAVIFMELGE